MLEFQLRSCAFVSLNLPEILFLGSRLSLALPQFPVQIKLIFQMTGRGSIFRPQSSALQAKTMIDPNLSSP